MMDAWEQLVEGWRGDVDIGGFSRVTFAAEAVLKEDLADFEIEWISSSLLRFPVHLLDLISSHARDSSWVKPLTDAFKIITILIEKYPQCSDQYHDDIVEICQSPFEARVRGAALKCLAARAARSLIGLRPATFISELEAANTCKAPLATLIGTICEFHPEAMSDDINRVWRAYLNLLDVNKNTEAVRKAALIGAGQVLTCFGDELPVSEVALIYPALTTNMDDVCLELLEKHASLFREKLASESALRRRLWAAAAESARAARTARAVTDAACRGAPDRAQHIVENEIVPLFSHRVARVRYAAMRVCCARARDVTNMVDVHGLEFQLRTEIDDVPDYVAEAVCFCVEARVPHSTVLLQTAILFYERLPPARLQDIVVAGLRSEAELADFYFNGSALEFLVNESSRPGGLERYRALWGALCGGSARSAVADQLARYTSAQLRKHALTVNEEFPAQLECLLRVCACALCPANESALRVLRAPLCAAVRPARVPPSVMLLLPLLPHGDDVSHLYKCVDIVRARDEESLCASALAVLHAPHGTAPPHTVLAAAELVLSRKDAEASTLSVALRSLSRLLDNKPSMDKERISHVVRLAERVRARSLSAGGGKDARVLRRDLHIFLGKHGRRDECIGELELLVAEFGDRLTLTLPTDGDVDCQLNLKRILKLALEHEDDDSLEMLTAILCDHPEMRGVSPPGVMLSVLSHVLSVRARRAARGEGPAPRAPDVPPLAVHLMQRICVCVSVGTRRVLCDAVRPLLRDGTLADATEYVIDMLHADTLVGRLGAVDATVPVVSALREDSVRARDLLPRLPPLLVGVNEPACCDVLQLTTDACLHIRHVFCENALDTMIDDLLKSLLHTPVTTQLHATTFKTNLHTTVLFIKSLGLDGATVIDRLLMLCKRNDKTSQVSQWYKRDDNSSQVLHQSERDDVSKDIKQCEQDGCSAQCLYIVAVVKREFDMDGREAVREGRLVEGMKRGKGGEFETEAVLMFVAEFADVLLENYYEDTISALCDVITSLPPRCVPALRPALGACARALGAPPRALTLALETWVDRLPLTDIADHLQSFNFNFTHAEAVAALRGMLASWQVTHAAYLLTSATATAAVWPPLVLRLYAQAPETLQEHMSYLCDLVWVGVRLGPEHTLPRLLAEDRSISDGAFARDFMPALLPFLLRKPFVLCMPELVSCCTLLRDVAACCTHQHGNELLELADEVWDRYCTSANAVSCAALVTSLVRLGASERARCVVETARRVSDAARPLTERAILLPALPSFPNLCGAYVSFARELPARLSECVGERAQALRSVLDAAASTPHATLLDLLAKLAAGDETRGWWDSAMDSCMASLAISATGDTIQDLHARVQHNPLSTAAADRLLVPLIRYCSASACEQFFSRSLASMLASLRSACPAADSLAYRRAVVTRTLTATLLTLMVEKVGRGSLESPASVLHRGAGGGVRPWHYVREACKLLVTLQGKTTTPQAACTELAAAVSVFQQRAYCALSALLCAWRPDDKLFDTVVGAPWDKLVDTETYSLPLRAYTSRRALVAAGGERPSTAGGGASTARTARTARLFLRTLSENPYSFDLFDEEEDESECVELVVSDSALNRHPCAAAISALLRHLASRQHTTPAPGPALTLGVTATGPAVAAAEGAPGLSQPAPRWLKTLCNSLCNARQNVRWLLAQCIVNVRAELCAHAGSLSAPLLTIVQETCTHTLNSLHVDILETVSWWRSAPGCPSQQPAPPPASLLRACAGALVRSCVDVRDRRALHYALLGTASAFFKEFPHTHVDWEEIKKHLDGGDAGAVAACWRVLVRVARSSVHIPELVPALLERLNTDHQQVGEIAKLFGLAVVCMKSESERARAWEQYGGVAARVRRENLAHYVNMLYYSHCTHVQHFKHVADAAAKVPAVRDKCVSVLAASLRANMLADTLANCVRELQEQLSAELRSAVREKCPHLAFEEIFWCESPSPPPAKRARSEHVLSRVLDTRNKERAFAHALARLAPHERWDKLDDKLAEDLPTRLVECLYVCVYLPLKHPLPPPGGAGSEEGGRLTDLLTLLLRRLRTRPRHARATIPAPVVARAEGVQHASRGARVGTLRTHAPRTLTARARTHTRTRPVTASEEVSEDAPIPLDKALETFLRFGESCWEASESLCVSVWRALGGSEMSALASTCANMLADTLAAAPSMLRLATDLAPFLQDITPYVCPVQRLSGEWRGSEAMDELRMLQCELRARIGPHPALTPLGLPPSSDSDDHDDVTARADNQQFSIEALVESFGSLSEWSMCTIAARRRAERALPPLWTSAEHFRDLLHSYRPEDSGWFAWCVRVRRSVGEAPRALRAVSAWPHTRFHLAAVVESMELRADTTVTSVPAPQDDSCLVEWAARLQLRARGTQRRGPLSRSHALAWTRAAIARHLPRQALQCVRTVTDEGELLESEVLGWVNARARALRLAASERGTDARRDTLERALRTAESGSQFVAVSNAGDVLEMCVLVLQLHVDLNSLTDDIVASTVQQASQAYERDTASTCERAGMRDVCDEAILYYEHTWSTRDMDRSLTLICDILRVCASETGVAVLLNRLAASEQEGEIQNIGHDAADCLLGTLLAVVPSQAEHYAARLVACLPTLPAAARQKHKDAIHKLTDTSLDQWRACVQLLCGAQQTLLAHCETLEVALHDNDASAWERAFERMRAEVFENELAGPDYRALHNHKDNLYSIQHAGVEMTPPATARCLSTLRSVSSSLRVPPCARRRVSALCPALATPTTDVTHALANLLRLSASDVLGLEDEMVVFTDSVCAPCIVCVRMRGGARRRYLLKRERASLAACAARAARALAPHDSRHHPPQVIVLSEECDLTEFLEGHERVRDLIQEEIDLAGIRVERAARRNEELILAPKHLALKTFERIVQQVPPLAFRRAFERRCADTAHVLRAQRAFVRSAAHMALHTWLLGLGDRHLHNVLTSPRAGSLRAVDAGALLTRDLVPVRLTAQLTALAPQGWVQAALEQEVVSLRDRQRHVLPLVKLALYNAAEHVHEVSVIEALVRGTLLPHEATAAALQRRRVPHALDFVRMLHDLFAHVPAAPSYTVEQQVSCLLVQSTSPRVLSVVRTEWEPWL